MELKKKDEPSGGLRNPYEIQSINFFSHATHARQYSLHLRTIHINPEAYPLENLTCDGADRFHSIFFEPAGEDELIEG